MSRANSITLLTRPTALSRGLLGLVRSPSSPRPGVRRNDMRLGWPRQGEPLPPLAERQPSDRAHRVTGTGGGAPWTALDPAACAPLPADGRRLQGNGVVERLPNRARGAGACLSCLARRLSHRAVETHHARGQPHLHEPPGHCGCLRLANPQCASAPCCLALPPQQTQRIGRSTCEG